MKNRKKYIFKSISLDKKYAVFKSVLNWEQEDLEKKTKLWISSDYLFNESILKNPEKTKKTIDSLLRWNTLNEKYENCRKLSEMIYKCESHIKNSNKK